MPEGYEFIYHVLDPRDLMSVKYVGRAANTIERRQAHERNAMAGCKRNLYRWWRAMLARGVEPLLLPVGEAVPSAEAPQAEQAEIDKCWSEGHALLNMRDELTDAEAQRMVDLDENQLSLEPEFMRGKLQRFERWLQNCLDDFGNWPKWKHESHGLTLLAPMWFRGDTAPTFMKANDMQCSAKAHLQLLHSAIVVLERKLSIA